MSLSSQSLLYKEREKQAVNIMLNAMKWGVLQSAVISQEQNYLNLGGGRLREDFLAHWIN